MPDDATAATDDATAATDDATAATAATDAAGDSTAPRLHVDVHDGDGPYLLLVHGMLSSRAQWMPNLAAFSQYSRPVVVELWGHGRSPTPEQPHHYTPDAYVAQFERLREELGAERWLICGQSLGASLTLRYVLTHPRRAIAHVFTNTNSALAEPADPRRIAYWQEQIKRVREDGREDDVFALIGPKKVDVPWKVLEHQGWIATATCTEVRLPLPESMRMSYAVAGSWMSCETSWLTIPASRR